jgi:hypothetical protein
MAINFDNIPKENGSQGFAPIKKGLYRGVIRKSEMKKKDGGGVYLNVMFDLFDESGKKAGVLYDNFVDSEKQYPQYKIGRFVRALGLNIKGSMELRDLQKLLGTKSLVVDVDQPEGKRFAEVTAWSDCYHMLSEHPYLNPDAKDADTEVPFPTDEDEPEFKEDGEEDEY